MARVSTAAAFVKVAMPLGQGGTLTDQEAFDVAMYFTQQPRPDFAGKQNDWPAEASRRTRGIDASKVELRGAALYSR